MSPKRIGINTLFMIPNGVGGTEQHLRAALSSLEKQDKINRYVVFCNNENFDTFQFTNPLWKKVRCPIRATSRPIRILFEQLILPFLVKKEKCSSLHSFGYFGPLVCPCKHIITIHDCNWRDCPEDFSFIERTMLSVLIEFNLKNAHHIITDSEFSKTRLLHHFPFIKKRLTVASPVLSTEFLYESKKKHVHPFHNKKYLLCVSALHPHKKIPYLLDLWEKIEEQDKRLYLVLIGRHGKDESKVRQRIRQLPRVYYKPNVSLHQLVSFYKYSKAFIFPSIYEGFGYPVYEAVHVGKTVFVGKKELYVKAIQRNVQELSFDPSQDATLIVSKMNDEKMNKKLI